MADLQSFLSNFFPNFPFRIINHSKEDIPMLFLCSSFIFFTFCVLILSFSLYKRLKKIDLEQNQELIKNPNEIDPVELGHYLTESNPTHLTRSVLFEVLPADSPKWESLFVKEGFDGDDDDLDFKGFDSDKELRDCGLEQGKRKKKKGKRKKLNSLKGEEERDEMDFGSCSEQELTLLYPFTSSSSVMQRKIKQQYEELMKCNESKELTLAQVRQFANCLINARSKLQHKADVIHRKFTITKALLYKADRSSFDRLRQQINKLELEQKRLEEDTFVYNWLQQQLKFSPAYKKLLEIGTCMELLKKSKKATENTDHEYTDTSFEELLAREKKDSFWQRNGKLRSCSS